MGDVRLRVRHEEGLALIAALMVLVVIIVLGSAAIYFSSSTSRTAERGSSTSVARSLSEGGLASALAVVAAPTNDRSDPNLVSQTTNTYPEGDVTWSGTYDPVNGVWSLTSEAVVPNPTGAGPISNTVQAKVWVADIVYASEADLGDGTTDYELWAMNSDGTGGRSLTNNAVAERYPHWSTDGQHLVLSSELADDAAAGATSGSTGATPNANRDIYTMDIDGTNLTRLTSNPGTAGLTFSSDEQDPTWGPSNKIFYASMINGHLGGGPPATQSNRDIYIMDTDGANKTNLTPCTFGPDSYWTESSTQCSGDEEPSWSTPAGLVCMESSAQTGVYSIHAIPITVNPDGSVTTGTPYDMIGVPGAQHLNCAFSKDGTKMVYASDRDGDFEIFLRDLVAGTDTQLTFNLVEDRQPGFTIDGRIIFGSHLDAGAPNSNNPDGNRELFRMNSDGTGLWQLTATTGLTVNNWPDIRHEFRPYDYSG